MRTMRTLGVRHMCAALATVLALSATTAGEAGAAASPTYHRLPGRATNLAATGDRYLAYGNWKSGTLAVVDTKTRSRRTVHLPAGCVLKAGIHSPPLMPAASDRVLVRCTNDDGLLNEATGVVERVPWPAGSEWVDMGTQWLQSQNGTYRNWHTGETRQLDPSIAPDLNDPDLEAPHPCVDISPPDDGQVLPELDGWRLLYVYGGRLQLIRCGSPLRTAKYLSRGDTFSSTSLLGGWTVWATRAKRCRDGRIGTYDLSSRRRRLFAPPFSGINRCVERVAQTRYAALLAQPAGSYDIDRYPAPVYRFTLMSRPR
jgi:hypothetical protein